MEIITALLIGHVLGVFSAIAIARRMLGPKLTEDASAQAKMVRRAAEIVGVVSILPALVAGSVAGAAFIGKFAALLADLPLLAGVAIVTGLVIFIFVLVGFWLGAQLGRFISGSRNQAI